MSWLAFDACVGVFQTVLHGFSPARSEMMGCLLQGAALCIQFDWLTKRSLRIGRNFASLAVSSSQAVHCACLFDKHAVDEKMSEIGRPFLHRSPSRGVMKSFLHGIMVRLSVLPVRQDDEVVDGVDTRSVVTSSCTAPLGPDPPGFRVVRVYSRRIEHDYFTLDDPPSQVEMGSEND